MQPASFDEMDYEEGADLAQRAMELHQQDLEFFGKMITEHAKAVVKASGGRLV